MYPIFSTNQPRGPRVRPALPRLGSLVHPRSGVPTKRPSDLPNSTMGNTRRRIDDEGEGGTNFVLADGALPAAVVPTRNWKKGQTPRDRTVDTTQSGPPLPGRTRLVLRFEKDANVVDDWNPVVPDLINLIGEGLTKERNTATREKRRVAQGIRNVGLRTGSIVPNSKAAVQNDQPRGIKALTACCFSLCIKDIENIDEKIEKLGKRGRDRIAHMRCYSVKAGKIDIEGHHLDIAAKSIIWLNDKKKRCMVPDCEKPFCISATTPKSKDNNERDVKVHAKKSTKYTETEDAKTIAAFNTCGIPIESKHIYAAMDKETLEIVTHSLQDELKQATNTINRELTKYKNDKRKASKATADAAARERVIAARACDVEMS